MSLQVAANSLWKPSSWPIEHRHGHYRFDISRLDAKTDVQSVEWKGYPEKSHRVESASGTHGSRNYPVDLPLDSWSRQIALRLVTPSYSLKMPSRLVKTCLHILGNPATKNKSDKVATQNITTKPINRDSRQGRPICVDLRGVQHRPIVLLCLIDLNYLLELSVVSDRGFVQNLSN